MSLRIPGHVVMLFSSIWSIRNKFNAFLMSIFNTMSYGRALLINLRVAWTAVSAPPATPKPTCIGRSCSETLVHTDCTASLLAILLNTLPTAIGRMPPSFLRRAVNEEVSSASRDQYERFPFKIWFARRDIELRSRYLGSLISILTRSQTWTGRRPSTPPLLLPAKDLMVARTDSGVAHNGE